VRLLYQRGEFGAHETRAVAGALAAFALGLTFNGVMLMLNRAFFSLQSPWTPTAVALGNLVLNTALYGALHRLGIWGIPLAISLANIAGAAALLVLLRRRLGRVDFAETAGTLARVTAAGAVLAAVCYAAWALLDDAVGRSLAGQLVSLGGALLAGAGVYLISCRLLGVREIEPLLSLPARLRRR
jgi:putative peptidoglycan lipid II flippase